MAEQSNLRSSESTTTEATQPKQTTRFQYPRGDAVIGEFFAANVYKSAALIDVIYLFHLDYGAGADVSQILRERLMSAAQDGNSAATPTLTPPATKRTVDMPGNTVADTVADNADTTEETSTDTTTDTTVETSGSTHTDDTVDAGSTDTAPDNTADSTEQQSNTDEKSSDFNIAEMFD